MKQGDGTVSGSNVLRIVGVTLAISAVVDVASSYLGWRIPWYATTAVITLFQYACESDLNAQDRAAFHDWKETVTKDRA